MENKVKLLLSYGKKPKSDFDLGWKALIEKYAPDMYDFLTSIGESDTIKQVAKFQAEIVIIFNEKSVSTLDLLKEIKQTHPLVPVLIILSMKDDEQAVIDEFMACGAYKCYPQPMIIDTIIHDMFVALNME